MSKKTYGGTRKITRAITATICGDVVRYGKKYKSVAELFAAQETAECFKLTSDEVMNIYEECLANGRFEQIRWFICNKEGRLTKPYRGGRKNKNHMIPHDWEGRYD